MKRLLFVTGEGIGNFIQCIPVLRTIEENLKFSGVDIWHAYGSYSIPKNLIPYIDNMFIGHELQNIDFNKYEGVVTTSWTEKYVKTHIKLPQIADVHPLSMTSSEISTYLKIAKDLGVKEDNYIWHGKCNYNYVDEEYDVVISNGYNYLGRSQWGIKSYPYYDKVASILKAKGYKVCSLGTKEEYVPGTVNKTGLPLLDSLGLIKNSKMLLSNDTGLYHCANALEINNIVIFTATSILKNYDERFHKYSKIINKGLECQPCQKEGRWLKDCKDWPCKEIGAEIVAKKVMEDL
ncbi:MAG: glycosyltransferase family 9 protein [Pseudomonadota bacterium]